MENLYTIRVESRNPEFSTDGELKNGMQVDGFCLLCVRDGKPFMNVVSGMSTMEIAKFFMTDDECCSVLRQAAAIADGMRNAAKIKKETEKRQGGDAIGKLLAKMMNQNRQEEE